MRTRQWFGEDISEIIAARNEFDPQRTSKNTAPYIMVIHLNVLGPGMKHWIRSQSKSRIVITPKDRDVRKKELEVFEENAKPG